MAGFRYMRRYAGPVRAVIFDWAGTVVDHGCQAPTQAFVRLFERFGIEVRADEARGPMGVHKRDHARQMLELPRIRDLWRAQHGADPSEEDVERLYDAVTPVQIELLPEYAEPIEGVKEAVAALRARGIRIGSTTGYNRAMLDVVMDAAEARGFAPDVAVPSSEVRAGRPAPYLCWAALTQLGVWPAAAAVKVGDTPVDVEAGLNAGLWTVGVARTGNLAGLTAEEAARSESEPRIASAREALWRAGAHYVIDGMEGLAAAVGDIELRLARGERP